MCDSCNRSFYYICNKCKQIEDVSLQGNLTNDTSDLKEELNNSRKQVESLYEMNHVLIRKMEELNKDMKFKDNQLRNLKLRLNQTEQQREVQSVKQRKLDEEFFKQKMNEISAPKEDSEASRMNLLHKQKNVIDQLKTQYQNVIRKMKKDHAKNIMELVSSSALTFDPEKLPETVMGQQLAQAHSQNKYLASLIEEVKNNFEEEKKELEDKHRKDIQRIVVSYEKKLSDQREEQSVILSFGETEAYERINKIKDEYEEKLKSAKQEYDKEIKNLEKLMEQRLNEQRHELVTGFKEQLKRMLTMNELSLSSGSGSESSYKKAYEEFCNPTRSITSSFSSYNS
eukprot:gb/GECH01006197.1/.p1 GENE.gb/GECH01006197.1/~~gb/GECH01006197.1/.p1  ORF type:complete len:341 (+),score=105.21 gb/GECH01006197.1/:1-1023(+)